MPQNPLDTLKAYFASPGDGSTGSPFAPWQQSAQHLVEGGTQGLLGMLGLGDDSSQANRGGQLLAAGLPLAAPHPAITELLKVLQAEPEAIDATKLIANDKLGGWVPHRSMLIAPEGFELPSGTSPFIDRDPKLGDRYVQEQWRNVPSASKLPPSRIPPPPAGKKMSPLDLLRGFDSKYAGSGY